LRQHSSSRVREKNQDLAQEELVKAYTVRTRGGKNGNVDKINQDAFLTGLNLEGKSNNHIFGVYDGHGILGF
jgi:preprotein translocase subunit YajC